MFWGVSYILYTYSLYHNFGRALTVEKFDPQLIFHNSNTTFEQYNRKKIVKNVNIVHFGFHLSTVFFV